MKYSVGKQTQGVLNDRPGNAPRVGGDPSVRYAVLAAASSGDVQVRVVPFSALPSGLVAGASPLPLYAARWVESVLGAPSVRRGLTGVAGRLYRRLVCGRIRQGLEAMGLPEDGLVWCTPEELDGVVRSVVGPCDESVREALEGRILLGFELAKAVGTGRSSPQTILAAAEALVASGCAERQAAVEIDRHGAACRRCGSRRGIYPEACARCGSPFCPRCSQCATMGVARGCEPLYALAAPPFEQDRLSPSPGEWRLDPGLVAFLSPAQRKAFEALRSHVVGRLHRLLEGAAPRPMTPPDAGQADGQSGGQPLGAPADAPDGCLVWAVTGAGKTEVAFGAAEAVLRLGGRVLFAVPRREIAAELALRAERAFGGRRARLLMGRGGGEGAGGTPNSAAGWAAPLRDALVVATTHQALRLYRAFALVILDEFDAFPYAGSDMLTLAVRRAAHPQGFRVVMSATPGQEHLTTARQAGWPVVHIPARHHGYPLPVPQVWIDRAMSRWQQAPDDPSRVPAFVVAWLADRRPDSRVLVFCPTVALAERVAASLRAPVCHSAHPRRAQTLAEFASSRSGVLVTTTLLERGVTFPGVDVMVAFADHEAIFDEAALVQMAGRAGRSAERPDGRVLFAAATRTRAMAQAVDAIEAMNRLALSQGLLHHGGPSA